MLTPLLKRLEAAWLVRRTRNPDNKRQVVVALADGGLVLRSRLVVLAIRCAPHRGRARRT
jgi:DNA-binding MarR family transcriptional regulator